MASGTPPTYTPRRNSPAFSPRGSRRAYLADAVVPSAEAAVRPPRGADRRRDLADGDGVEAPCADDVPARR